MPKSNILPTFGGPGKDHGKSNGGARTAAAAATGHADAAARLEAGNHYRKPLPKTPTRTSPSSHTPEGSQSASPSFKPTLGFKEKNVYLNLSEDLCCLALSSWFVGSVKQKWRGLGYFFITSAIQFIFLFYMTLVIYYKVDEGVEDCTAPTLMSFCAVYVYGSAVIADFNSHNALQGGRRYRCRRSRRRQLIAHSWTSSPTNPTSGNLLRAREEHRG